MAEISAKLVKELREKTGVGMMDCKKALQDSEGDFEKAIIILREKGLAKAAKRESKETKEGKVLSYIHPGGKVGVLLELNCETDFVAKTEDFDELGKDIAMHIAALNPPFLSSDKVPVDYIEKEKEIFITQLKNEGKPENIIPNIVAGKVKKMYQEVCLLEQPFVKNDKITVEERIKESFLKIGEKISVKRFARFKLGEE
ncbi:MAG: translation elongation factor Ts [Pseudomonadota bacterium]